MTDKKTNPERAVQLPEETLDRVQGGSSDAAGLDRDRRFLRPLDDMIERIATDQEVYPES